MRAPWKRAAALALATCTISFQTGCKTDVEKSDEAVAADLTLASQHLTTGHPEKATEALEKDVSKGSPFSRVQSNSLLAQAEVDAADAALRKLSQLEAQISANLISLERIGWQLGTNNGSVSGFQAQNPAPSQQALEQVAAAAEKGQNGAWVAGEAPVPSLADVKQRQENLKKQIDDLTKQRTDLAAKRALALQESAKFSKQADAANGQDSVGFYIQGSNQRKEAADLEVAMRDVDAKILPLQQQLTVADEQAQAIQSTLTSIQDQVQKLQGGWQAVQKQMDQINEFSKSLLDGSGAAAAAPPTTAPAANGAAPSTQPVISLNSLASDLTQQIASAQELRTQAAGLLDKAYKHLEDASKSAASALQTLPKPNSADTGKLPEKAAWQALIDLNQPAEFKLRQAAVLSRLARLYSGQFIELAQRNAVARLLEPALKQAKLELPALAGIGSGAAASAAVREGAGKIAGDIVKADFTGFADTAGQLETLAPAGAPANDQEAVAAVRADFDYLYADNLLNDIINGSAGQGDLAQLRVNAAHLLRMSNYYGWSHIGELQGKAQEAKGRLATAVSERKILSEGAGKGLLPPALPPELAEVATTQPTSQPAGEGAAPASQPAATEPAAPASPGTVATDNADQAAARKAAVEFANALYSGDTEKAVPFITGVRLEYTTLANYVKAYTDFQKAAVEKFGDEAKSIVASPIQDIREQVSTAPITINGNFAEFPSANGNNNPLRAQKVGDTWKMDFTPANQTVASKQLTMLTRLAPAFSRAVISIQNGRFKTVDDVKKALAQELQSSFPEMFAPASQPAQ